MFGIVSMTVIVLRPNIISNYSYFIFSVHSIFLHSRKPNSILGVEVLLKVKLGDRVSKGESLFNIYAEKNWKMDTAITLAESLEPIGVGKRVEDRMLINRIPMKIASKKPFMLER